ncbi:hypothetical protein [Endozoicomonas sp. 8E]|uniref:hypothetical protein n=1 Tax=Endozoicomonas sp. 8E TaxID=3035692 RepID=UPI00293921BA|nr:hypothetical protein [Endozoicomonas sp. 8E]WOG26940.1 hypothetical protein P6910_20680 [Endozoicomonas sp. 8E]
MLLSLSVIIRANPLTRRFIVELEHNTDSPNQNFSIKPDWHILSDNLSDIAEKKDYTETALSSDDKRHRPNDYGVTTPFIGSISWQWLYATNLLVAYELILTTGNNRESSHHCSWVPVEAAIAVGQLLKSYWNPYSPLFNPIEPRETSENHTFAITTMMHGSIDDQQQGQPSKSSGQQAPQVTTHSAGSFNHFLYSDSGEGNQSPQQHSHTLGLNCFVHPCNGLCQFLQPSDSSDSGAIKSVKISKDYTGATPKPRSCPHLDNRHCYSCNSANGVASNPLAAGTANTAPAPAGLATCNVIVFREGGQLIQCGKICKTKRSLSSHKSNYHTGQKTCYMTMVGEDGLQRSCGRICKNAQTLSDHKKSVHTGQQICDVTLVREDGQSRQCGAVRKSAKALSDHKSKYHTGQRTCEVKMVGEDGIQRICGMVCKSAQNLLDHKRRNHTGQKICDATVVGENGQQCRCGKVCKSAKALVNHKRVDHSGQKTCDETVVGKDGQQRPCGTTCKNAAALSTHKSSFHRGQKTCDLTVVGEDGQQLRCGTTLKNAKALYAHKRAHRKRKPVDEN